MPAAVRYWVYVTVEQTLIKYYLSLSTVH